MTTASAAIANLGLKDFTTPVIVVKADAGPSYRWIETEMKKMSIPGVRSFVVCCDFDQGGPWAGVVELFSVLFDEIREHRPDLIAKHADDLAQVLPQQRHVLQLSHPTLTDVAPSNEKVRNYPADRAFRIVHGLIDLLDEWKIATAADATWVIGCHRYDAAGAIGTRFFQELMRRRMAKLQLHLLLGVDPGKAEEVQASFVHRSVPAAILAVNLEPEPRQFIPVQEAARQAVILENAIGTDLEKGIEADNEEVRIHLPDLLRLWQLAGRYDKLLQYKFFGITYFGHRGYYQDALRYGSGLLDLAATHAPGNIDLRWWIIIKTMNGLTGLLDWQAGLKLALQEALPIAEKVRPLLRINLFYLIAMLYARHQQPRDFVTGEEYLARGLAVLESSEIPDTDRHFWSVFYRNGVAMIRSFQGRLQEALELCQQGIDELNKYLAPDKHRLHRSVLLYNIAQVYVAAGAPDLAIEYYTAAMAMDPNYSEYYNERGNIYLKLGRLEEAKNDYLQAIEFSAPYFEVFTNLGQCYRKMGNMELAIQAYSRALDLEPEQMLALLGLAKAYEESGHYENAIAGYTAALARDPQQWEAMASRGIMRYEMADLDGSLADFDRAIELAPEQADLRQNRSVVLADLDRYAEAADDLAAALKLNPSSDERQSLQLRLETMLKSVAKPA